MNEPQREWRNWRWVETHPDRFTYIAPDAPSWERLAAQIALERRVAREGVPTAPILEVDPVARHVVYSRVHGLCGEAIERSVFAGDAPLDRYAEHPLTPWGVRFARSLGETIGRLHQTDGHGLPRPSLDVDAVREALVRAGVPELVTQLAWIAGWTTEHPGRGFVHGDLRFSNLVVDPDGEILAVLGFDEARNAPGAFDLRYTLSHGPVFACAVLDAYNAFAIQPAAWDHVRLFHLHAAFDHVHPQAGTTDSAAWVAWAEEAGRFADTACTPRMPPTSSTMSLDVLTGPVLQQLLHADLSVVEVLDLRPASPDPLQVRAIAAVFSGRLLRAQPVGLTFRGGLQELVDHAWDRRWMEWEVMDRFVARILVRWVADLTTLDALVGGGQHARLIKVVRAWRSDPAKGLSMLRTLLNGLAKTAPPLVRDFLHAARSLVGELKGALVEGAHGNDYPAVVGDWTGFANGTSGLVRGWVGDGDDGPLDDPSFRAWMERAAEEELNRNMF